MPNVKFLGENKAQAVLIDFTMALFIFTIVSGYLGTIWAMNYFTMEKNYLMDDMQRLCFQAADLLVSSKGVPVNWETMPLDDANTIGLAASERVIDEQKLNRFKNLGGDYGKAKELLNMANYDFYFELHGSDDVNAGLQPMAEAYKVVVKRIVEYKGEEADVTFTLYKIWP